MTRSSAPGYWARVNSPEEGQAVLDGTPIKLSATPGGVMAPGPLLGEHTDAVLGRLLGYSEEDIAQLKEARVVASQAEIMAERARRIVAPRSDVCLCKHQRD